MTAMTQSPGDSGDHDALVRFTATRCPSCGASDPYGNEIARFGVAYRIEVACWACQSPAEVTICWGARS